MRQRWEIRIERESIRVKSNVALGILREGPCALWSLDMGNEITKIVLGTTMKALLEKTTII